MVRRISGARASSPSSVKNAAMRIVWAVGAPVAGSFATGDAGGTAAVVAGVVSSSGAGPDWAGGFSTTGETWTATAMVGVVVGATVTGATVVVAATVVVVAGATVGATVLNEDELGVSSFGAVVVGAVLDELLLDELDGVTVVVGGHGFGAVAPADCAPTNRATPNETVARTVRIFTAGLLEGVGLRERPYERGATWVWRD